MTNSNPPSLPSLGHANELADGLRFCNEHLTACRVTLDSVKQYEVRLFADGDAKVWRLFDRNPVNRRGYYGADNGARRVDPHGKAGRRAVEAATRLMQELLATKARGQ